jgi:lipoyl(octanoyl) transferase
MIISRDFGLVDINACWEQMKQFTDNRDSQTHDEIWFVEHKPVYTLGLNSDIKHIINPKDIPIVKLDRGGQVTYHGPGQLIMYTLFDIARLEYSIRRFIELIEKVTIEALACCKLAAAGNRNAPGVYVDSKKIASLGIRVKKGRSYHGVAINHNPDLGPFNGINPCGYEGMRVTSLQELNISIERSDLMDYLESAYQKMLNTEVVRYDPLVI